MIKNFFIYLWLIVDKQNSFILLNELKSIAGQLGGMDDIELIVRDDDDLIAFNIERGQCDDDFFISEPLENYLRANNEKIKEVIANYTFEHEGQCDLEFNGIFLRKAADLFDSLCVTSYLSDQDN